MTMQPYERLRWARESAGYESGSDAARAMGVGVPTYISHENGHRGFKRAAWRYAEFFGVSVDWLTKGRGQSRIDNSDIPVPINTQMTHAKKRIAAASTNAKIKVIGRVAAGVFREIEPMTSSWFPDSPFPPDPQYPIAAQYDLIVEGNSINRFARDGEILRCLDIHKAIVEPVDGDLLVVRRTRHGLAETTAKRGRRKNGAWELWFDSEDPSFQGIVPLEVQDGDQIEIIAVVLYAYRPARPLAAMP